MVATLASYIQRVYSEFGKILSREVQENLDAWEVRIEPHLGLSREHAALCASVLKQLALGLIALGFGALLFIRPTHPGPPNTLEIAQAILAVVLVVVFAYQLIPVAALQPHARAVGGAAALAHPPAAVDRHAGHCFHPLLLFHCGAGRGSRRARRRTRPPMSKR